MSTIEELRQQIKSAENQLKKKDNLSPEEKELFEYREWHKKMREQAKEFWASPIGKQRINEAMGREDLNKKDNDN